MMDKPNKSTYLPNIVLRVSGCAPFLSPRSLNDVDVLACNVQNAYINAETKEKVWFHGGDEMGSAKERSLQSFVSCMNSNCQERDGESSHMAGSNITQCQISKL